MIIYKITNNINNKVYIGLTTCSLEYRWKRHITECRNLNNKKHLYRAMRTYGLENFSVEQIDETDDFKELGKMERYYIRSYNSTNPLYGYNLTAGGESHQYDGNSSAKLTYDEVVQIREIYAMCELSCKECWMMYSDKISYSGFQKIWDGFSWHGIMDEIYTEANIEAHRCHRRNPGSKNGNAKLSEEQVSEIRKYYVDHTLQETYDRYGHNYTKDGFRQILNRTYSNIPIYRKMKKCWTLNDAVIDIDEYNPVSTISESGE